MVSQYLPTKADEEELQAIIHEIKELVEWLVHPRQVTVVDVGSTAKGTWLRNDSDIDIYIFNERPDLIYDTVSRHFLDGHEKKGRLKIWNFNYGEYDVDLIFANPKDKKREDTVKHTAYFRTHLTTKMRREVRKAKAYFKTEGVYGAEIGGIIGVAIEELIVREQTLKGICKLLSGVRPYIQDPTMNDARDLLACINTKRWTQLQKACQRFLEKQRFKYRPMTSEKFHEKYKLTHCTLMYRRKFDKGLDYQTARSITEKVSRILRHTEREVELDYDTFVDNDKVIICYRVCPLELSLEKEVCVSPELANVEAFIDAHERVYARLDPREVCATVKRKIIFPDTYFIREVDQRMKGRGYLRR